MYLERGDAIKKKKKKKKIIIIIIVMLTDSFSTRSKQVKDTDN